MKISTPFIAIMLSLITFASQADLSKDLAIYITTEKQGVISIREESYYTKEFTISMVNLSKKTINLNKLCFEAFSYYPYKSFTTDIIDKKLTLGVLEPNNSIKGKIIFISKNNNLYNTERIKVIDNCN